MSSGARKNQSKAASYTKKAVNALQPQSYSDPFGSFNNGHFTPSLSATQNQTLSGIDSGIYNAMNQIPQSFNVNDYYNNPFYGSTYAQLTAPLNQNYNWDMNQLNSNLNAQGQVGSSYDALMHQMLNQNYNNQYMQAAGQARQASANAYQQAYQNNMNNIQGLSNLKTNMMNQIYQPAQTALNYQNAVAPLQQGQAQAYGNMAQNWWNRTTPMQNTLGFLAGPVGAQLVKSGASLLGGGGSAAGAGGGAAGAAAAGAGAGAAAGAAGAAGAGASAAETAMELAPMLLA